MKKCIATGTILFQKDTDGKFLKEIVATVYEDEDASEESVSTGSGSGSEARKSVLLKYKNFKYTDDIVTPIGYEEIAEEATLTVPGFDGHAAVTLTAPLVIKYSKTRSFERSGNTVVSATLRYDM